MTNYEETIKVSTKKERTCLLFICLLDSDQRTGTGKEEKPNPGVRGLLRGCRCSAHSAEHPGHNNGGNYRLRP